MKCFHKCSYWNWTVNKINIHSKNIEKNSENIAKKYKFPLLSNSDYGTKRRLNSLKLQIKKKEKNQLYIV